MGKSSAAFPSIPSVTLSKKYAARHRTCSCGWRRPWGPMSAVTIWHTV